MTRNITLMLISKYLTGLMELHHKSLDHVEFWCTSDVTLYDLFWKLS